MLECHAKEHVEVIARIPTHIPPLFTWSGWLFLILICASASSVVNHFHVLYISYHCRLLCIKTHELNGCVSRDDARTGWLSSSARLPYACRIAIACRIAAATDRAEREQCSEAHGGRRHDEQRSRESRPSPSRWWLEQTGKFYPRCTRR